MGDRRSQLEKFIDGAPEVPGDRSNLGSALYSMSELGLWPDEVDSVSVEQACLIWKLVQQVAANGFPKELRM